MSSLKEWTICSLYLHHLAQGLARYLPSHKYLLYEKLAGGSPGGSVVESLPANAGDSLDP